MHKKEWTVKGSDIETPKQLLQLFSIMQLKITVIDGTTEHKAVQRAGLMHLFEPDDGECMWE